MLWKYLCCTDASYLNMNKVLCTAWIIPSAFEGVLFTPFGSISTYFACSKAQTETCCKPMTNHCLHGSEPHSHGVSFDHNRDHQPPMFQHKDITWDLVHCTHLKANLSQEKFKESHWHKSRSEIKKTSRQMHFSWVKFLKAERLSKFYSDLP